MEDGNKKELTDEQLDQVAGGAVSLTYDGVTVTLGGPETYLQFAEMERKCGFKGYSGTPREEDAMYYNYAYQSWYYSHYGKSHPFDQR